MGEGLLVYLSQNLKIFSMGPMRIPMNSSTLFTNTGI